MGFRTPNCRLLELVRGVLANSDFLWARGDLLMREARSGGNFTPSAAIVSAMKGMTDHLVGHIDVFGFLWTA